MAEVHLQLVLHMELATRGRLYLQLLHPLFLASNKPTQSGETKATIMMHTFRQSWKYLLRTGFKAWQIMMASSETWFTVNQKKKNMTWKLNLGYFFQSYMSVLIMVLKHNCIFKLVRNAQLQWKVLCFI